jgi:hypothetical protein
MKSKILILISVAFVLSCKKADTTSQADIQETAQQVGDVMASVDESGGSSGSLASAEAFEKSLHNTMERFAPGSAPEPSMIASLMLPKAEAVSCFGFGFGACSGGAPFKIIRNYNNCTVGSAGTATLSGTVEVTWSAGTGSAITGCSLVDAGNIITRNPNFILTGRRGATLAVTKTGTNGQRLTWASGTGSNKVFNFSNDGINRKFTANGSTLFDQTTTTTTAISVTGVSRSNRVMNGGSLRVTNNLTAVTCDYVPTNVTWASTCNCPTSGSWAGSCSDGKSVTLDINGCGTAKYTEGSEVEDVTFDRCASN